jgi:hypothetical protein
MRSYTICDYHQVGLFVRQLNEEGWSWRGTCNTCKNWERPIKFRSKYLNGTHHLRDLVVDGEILRRPFGLHDAPHMAIFNCPLYSYPGTPSMLKEHILKLQNVCTVQVKQDPPLLCILLLVPGTPPVVAARAPPIHRGTAAAGPSIASPHVCQHSNTRRTSCFRRNVYRAIHYTPVLLIRVSLCDSSLQYVKHKSANFQHTYVRRTLIDNEVAVHY